MARYETVRAQLDGCGNACNAAYFSDTKTGKDLSPAEVCDLLNAHDGMMTREQVEKDFARAKNLWDTSQFCSLQVKGEMRALQQVLNGGRDDEPMRDCQTCRSSVLRCAARA